MFIAVPSWPPLRESRHANGLNMGIALHVSKRSLWKGVHSVRLLNTNSCARNEKKGVQERLLSHLRTPGQSLREVGAHDRLSSCIKTQPTQI